MPLHGVWPRARKQIKFTVHRVMQVFLSLQNAFLLVRWSLRSWADFAQEKEIDLTIIGMDDPLVGGVVDVFEERGLKVFGPRKNAAILEGSKAFSKDLMKKYNIPTAGYENFDNAENALEYLRTQAKFPIVLESRRTCIGKGCFDLQ